MSVALCTHNGERYLGAQLASILGQTVPPAEVVISDDASTDGTTPILEEFAAEASARGVAVTLLHNAVALGVTANFEKAIRACSGQFILLSDQDDVWEPERVERTVAALEGADLVFTDATLVDANGRPIGRGLFEELGIADSELDAVRTGKAFAVLVRRNLATGATVGFRSTLLASALPIPSPWVHDEWLAMIAAVVGRVAVLDERLVRYRQHGANQIGVRQRTLRYKAGKVLEPRGQRNAGIVARAATLLERLEAIGADTGVRGVVEEKLRVETARLRLPRSRWRRIPPVLAAARRGDYRLTSQGRMDILRDVLQSHAEPR